MQIPEILGRIRSSFSAQKVRPELAVGARFSQVSHTAPVWVVDRIASPLDNLADHVTLRREDDPVSLKTLSVDALWDSGDFRIADLPDVSSPQGSA